MPTLADILEMLQSKAAPRPDLGQESPVATYLGRAVNPAQATLESVMATLPVNSAEEGSRMLPMMPGVGGAMAGMAKNFKPGPSTIAMLAKKGAVPQSPMEKMLPALIDEKTGQVMHGMTAGAGGHGALYSNVPKSWTPMRGFVDPVTFDAFTDKMLEEAMQRGRMF